MLRCFDCNTGADDARHLVENGSWTNNSPPGSLQHTVVTEARSMLSTEYKLKFQDFSGHCQRDGPAPDTSVTDGPVPGLGRAKTWYSDLLEARRKAVTYKVRGWGKESAPSHLVYLYDQAEDPSRPPDRKIISALYLETLQPGLARGRTSDGASSAGSRAGTADGRHPSRPGVSSVDSAVSRPHTQLNANAALKKSTTKAAVKPPVAERKSRPGTARRAGADTTADEVDKAAKSRSSSTPRAPQPLRVRGKSPGPRPAGSLSVAGGAARPRPVSAVVDGSAEQERGRAVAVHRPPKAEKPATATATNASDSAAAARAQSAAVLQEELAALLKSPPEPTRVRSPENCAALRSPEAVNWTLPLDTARAFTVTQNVGAGQSKTGGRPRSSHSTSSGQSQISPLHRRLVTEAMASRAPDPATDQTLSDRPRASPPPPPLVRPTGAPPGVPPDGDSRQQSFTDGPAAAAQLFSAGSAAPPQAAVVEMSAPGKPAPVRSADVREAPPYHVI